MTRSETFELSNDDFEKLINLLYSGEQEGCMFHCNYRGESKKELEREGEIIHYYGPLYQELPYGIGHLVLPNQKVYKFFSGRGNKSHINYKTLIYGDGTFYEGEIMERTNINCIDVPHGEGILRDIDGSIIHEGTWVIGCKWNRWSEIVWFCSPESFWYKNGRIFRIGRSPYYRMTSGPFWNYMLYPAVCLTPPNWHRNKPYEEKTFGICEIILLPHMASLGCPPLKNLFDVGMFAATPELAVQGAGFKDLKDYLISIHVPEIKIASNLSETFDAISTVLDIIGKFSENQFIEPLNKLSDFGKDYFENYVEKMKAEISESGLESIIKELNEYSNYQ